MIQRNAMIEYFLLPLLQLELWNIALRNYHCGYVGFLTFCLFGTIYFLLNSYQVKKMLCIKP